MALPVIVFFFLVLVGVALFVVGFTRFSAGAGFAFTSLSGVFFILTGLLLWTTGLQLDVIDAYDISSGVSVPVEYQTLTFALNPEIQILSYFFLFGGFVPIVWAFRNAIVFRSNSRQVASEEWEV